MDHDFTSSTDAQGNEWREPGSHLVAASVLNDIVDGDVTFWVDGTELHGRRETATRTDRGYSLIELCVCVLVIIVLVLLIVHYLPAR